MLHDGRAFADRYERSLRVPQRPPFPRMHIFHLISIFIDGETNLYYDQIKRVCKLGREKIRREQFHARMRFLRDDNATTYIVLALAAL